MGGARAPWRPLNNSTGKIALKHSFEKERESDGSSKGKGIDHTGYNNIIMEGQHQLKDGIVFLTSQLGPMKTESCGDYVSIDVS